MVMIEAILCAASLSLCYTATCYGIDECIGSCWCMGESKYKDPDLHNQAERPQIQWRRPSLGCCFHEDYNIMAFRIFINRFWLVGGKAFVLIGFPLLHMYSWCQSSAVDANYHAEKKTVQLPWDQHELHQYHLIHCSSPGQTPFRKVFRADTFHLPYKYDIISEPMR